MKSLCAALLCLLATGWPTRHSARHAVREKPAPAAVSTTTVPTTPVNVGSVGNEPIVLRASDGTLYISALQHFYRSTDGGASWTNLPGPPEASQLNLNSDSSIAVDPNNRVYFTFDYPYAGTTAVCTSDDRGDTWTCNPAVVPGGTDRMWVLAPTPTAAYEVTNEGLYETAFLMSSDGGLTWVPRAIGSGVLEPQSGPLLQQPCSAKVVQPIKIYGTAPSDVPELKLYVYDPATTGTVLSDVRPTGLELPTALPGGAFSQNGVLYVVSEEANSAGGRQVVMARSADEGVTWTKLPPLAGTTIGTATFTAVAAGAPGHVGVLYYYTLDNGDPGALLTSNWSAVWAESFDADTAAPTWTTTTVEPLIHTGAICVAASCMGSQRFAGDFISAVIDPAGAAHLTWMVQAIDPTSHLATGASAIHYARIQTGPASGYVAPPCGSIPLPVQLNAVVSRKTHATQTFDIGLPVTGTHGIECRSGGANGDHTLVFSFADPLTFVSSANVSSGNGSVSSSAIGSDPHQYIVHLTGVANAQHLFVTLHNVQDSAGHSSDSISAPMGVLLGDTTANGAVNSSDIAQTQSQSGQAVTSADFREDVTVSGTINSSDVALVQAQSGTSLP